MKFVFVFLLIATGFSSLAQTNYEDSMKLYIKNYIDNHEVVKGKDKKKLHFFDVNKKYRVLTTFERKQNMPWFPMATSGPIKKQYRVYGVVHFIIDGMPCQLNLYQSQSLMLTDQYKSLLFLPFTDATTGKETYESGRYIDLDMDAIKDNKIVIDFNKAYNPYCAYVSGVYNCPIPPQENHLNIPVKAGEKSFDKH